MACAEDLAAAKAALHALLMGDSVVEVTVNGRTTKYNPASIGKLQKYVNQLEIECGTSNKRRGAVMFVG